MMNGYFLRQWLKCPAMAVHNEENRSLNRGAPGARSVWRRSVLACIEENFQYGMWSMPEHIEPVTLDSVFQSPAQLLKRIYDTTTFILQNFIVDKKKPVIEGVVRLVDDEFILFGADVWDVALWLAETKHQTLLIRTFQPDHAEVILRPDDLEDLQSLLKDAAHDFDGVSTMPQVRPGEACFACRKIDCKFNERMQ